MLTKVTPAHRKRTREDEQAHTGNQPRTGWYLRLGPPLSRTAAVALATELEALKRQTWTSQTKL